MGGTGLSLRPTGRGWQAVIVGALVLVAARLIGTTQLHQLAYVLLLLPLASLAFGYLGSRNMVFGRMVGQQRITAGRPAPVELVLGNGSRVGISPSEVTDRLPDRRTFEFDALEAREEGRFKAEMTFGRRGVYALGPAEVSVVDPFDLLRFTRSFGEKSEVVVYPPVHDLRGFPVRSGSDSDGRGVVGRRGDEFAGLREYRRGDDRRHIHWKSVARTGDLYVKEYSLHSPRRFTVALDLKRGGIRQQDGPAEDAVSAAASVLTHLLSEGIPFRLLYSEKAAKSGNAGGVENGKDLDLPGFASDEGSYWRAMRGLASVRTNGSRSLADTLLDDAASLGEGTIIVSGNLDDDLHNCVRRLRTNGTSVVVVMVAAHTYVPSGGRGAEREAAFSSYVEGLDRAGATVRVVRHPEGVAGLAVGQVRVGGRS